MTIEERIRDAMGETGAYEPSGDLFAKVQRSIEEDRLHRRRIRSVVIGGMAFIAAVVAWLAVWWNPQPDAARLPWWSIVAAVVAFEVVIVIALGPAIRRFGRAYADDVFRTNPQTGGRFLALLDVAYYLVFSGLVLVSIPMDSELAWSRPGGAVAVLQEEGLRLGGVILAIGLLHAVTIFVLPFVGLVFASTQHRARVHTDKDDWPVEVRRAHRMVTVVVVVIGVFVAFQVLGLFLRLIGFAFDAAG